MDRESVLVRNTLILSIGKFLPKIFTFITLPIITVSLTKYEYGTYDLILTLLLLLLPIATLQIQSAAFRFLIDCRTNKKKTSMVITNIVIFTVPISLVAITILFLSLRNISIITRILVCIYFLGDIMSATIGQIARGLSYNKAYSIGSIIYSVINMITIVLTLSLGNLGLNGVLLAGGISSILSALYLSNKSKIIKNIDLRLISKGCIIKMISYSWPMIPNNLSNWILTISDKAIISFFLGVEANAIYAIANKIPSLLNIAQSTFVMAWQENASMASKDKDASEYYSKMFENVYCLLMGVTSLLIAFTPMIFKVIIWGDYEMAYYQMPILFIGTLFYCLSSFQGGIYIAYKKTKSVGITTIIAALINLIINLLFIKVIGITAASISTLLSYLFLFIYRIIDIKKFQYITYNYIKMIVLFSVIFIMCIICYKNNFVFNIINIIIGIIFSIVINLKIVKLMFNKAKLLFKNY